MGDHGPTRPKGLYASSHKQISLISWVPRTEPSAAACVLFSGGECNRRLRRMRPHATMGSAHGMRPSSLGVLHGDPAHRELQCSTADDTSRPAACEG